MFTSNYTLISRWLVRIKVDDIRANETCLNILQKTYSFNVYKLYAALG